MTTGVAREVTKGAAWMIASNTVDTVLKTLSTIVLARLLVPEDFGLMTLALSLGAMLFLLRSFSFDLVLIQKQTAGREEYDTAWTFTIIFAAFIAVLLVIAAPPFARLYDDPRLVHIIWLIALSNLLEAAQNIGIVDFRKNLQFGKEFLFGLLRRFANFAIVVGMALIYRNYWALVLGTVIGQAVTTALTFVMHPYRPRFTIVAWRGIFGFSKWNAVNAVAHAVSIRAGDFFVGKMAGPAGLGVFGMSNDIAFLTASSIGAPINRALYPGYARTAHDPPRLRNAFYRVMSLIAVVMMPAGIGLAAISDSLVPIFLGGKWMEAIPLIAVLAFRGLIHALIANVPFVFLAIGKPNLVAYALIARAVILLPLLVIGLQHWGVLGAACAFSASMALEIPIYLILMRQQVGIRIRTVLLSMWRPTVAAGLMALAVRWLTLTWTAPQATTPAVLRLAVLVGVGAVTYVASLLGLWRLSGRPSGAEQMALGELETRLAAWKTRTRDAT